jgi:hypothetical protein
MTGSDHAIFLQFSPVCLEDLRKTSNVSQASLFLSQDIQPEIPQSKAGVPTLQQ